MTAKKGVILRPAEVKPYERGNGARTMPLVVSGIGATSLLTGITIIDPGSAIPLHFHNCEESVTVLEGAATAVIDGVEHELRPSDTTWLPAGVPHFFRNPSTTSVLRILWIYASIDATRTLVATGETRRVDLERVTG
jgi:quercetin dioxygenase-like cupin family protein